MRLLNIATLVTVLAVAVAAPALSGKGGNGNGGNGGSGGSSGGGGSYSATLSIKPNDAAAWSRVWGSGCGYKANSEVYVDVQKPSALAFTSAMSDSSGCVSFTFTTDDPGTYDVSVRQQLSSGGHWTVMATYSLPVV
jgi:hypothetical protein